MTDTTSKPVWNVEPAAWSQLDDSTVAWTTSGVTDFWRHTGGVAPKHDGNAFLAALGAGDFVFEAEARGIMSDAYDQFGVFLEIDEEHWLKAGVEYDGGLWLSTVATHERSDWAREVYATAAVRLRLTRHDDTVQVFVAEADSWRMIREATFAGSARVGVYSCAPKGEGFSVLARYAYQPS